MALVRWDPFREMEGMRSRLNRFFASPPSLTEDDMMTFSGWAPAVDIQETEKEYLVKTDLPDVKKEDVRVAVENGVLSVEGERKQEKEENGKKFHRIERSYGKFVRRFALPTEVEADKVQADFKDGVLNVHLPKAVAAKPRAVEVKVA